MEEVNKQIDNTEAENWKTKYIYTLAELDNYKKRTQVDIKNKYNEGILSVILPILSIVDDFERAFTHNELAEGGKIIYKKFIDTLKSLDVNKIEINEDTEFDVNFHEAVSKIGDGNKIIDEVLSGYTMGNKVIRYSKVVVG